MREAIGDEVEVVAHLQIAVVGDVDGALRPAAMQGGDAGARQVVGMDVARVDVVAGREHRRAARDALARIAAAAIERVDAGNAQQGDGDAAGAAEVTQTLLGIDAAARRARSPAAAGADSSVSAPARSP